MYFLFRIVWNVYNIPSGRSKNTGEIGLYWWCQFIGKNYKYHKENTEVVLLNGNKETGLEVNTEKNLSTAYHSQSEKFLSLILNSYGATDMKMCHSSNILEWQ